MAGSVYVVSRALKQLESQEEHFASAAAAFEEAMQLSKALLKPTDRDLVQASSPLLPGISLTRRAAMDVRRGVECTGRFHVVFRTLSFPQ